MGFYNLYKCLVTFFMDDPLNSKFKNIMLLNSMIRQAMLYFLGLICCLTPNILDILYHPAIYKIPVLILYHLEILHKNILHSYIKFLRNLVFSHLNTHLNRKIRLIIKFIFKGTFYCNFYMTLFIYWVMVFPYFHHKFLYFFLIFCIHIIVYFLSLFQALLHEVKL